MRQKIIDYFANDYLYFYQKYLSEIEKAGLEQFKSICPFHGDTKPSLNFNRKTGQFFCHGCQKGGDIFSFYALIKNLDTKSDFSKICKGISGDFNLSGGLNPKSKISKTYDYLDSYGDLIFQVCRMEPKAFRQRRPDGNGGWIWNLQGVEPVLYRLPEVAEAESVLIVEGEKDVDNLRGLGFTATTAPMGAGKWRGYYNQYLAGKNVVLIPDNDGPGRDHMAAVADSLNGQAANIKMLELPELPELPAGGDATDFISMFQEKTEAAEILKKLIKQTPAYSIPEPERVSEIAPTETDDPDKLEFPAEVLSGAAGYFADVYSDYLEAPIQFLFIGYLTALGAVLSRSVRLNSLLDTQPRLYTLLVGESAADRKSTTLNVISKHFRSCIDGFSVCWGIGSAEGLRNVLNKSAGDDFCVLEKAKPPGTLLIFDEFKSFVSKCRIQTSVLLPCVNSLFESNLYETHTKNKSISIDDAHLAMLAASTLETYERIYDDSFIDIGFPNRVFLVIGTAERRFSIPKKIPESENRIMTDNLVKILRHVGNGIELDITPEAERIYHNWYLNLDRSVFSRRLDTYSLRLMQLFSVNNLKSEIDAETVNQATALCDWQLKTRQYFSPIDADTKIAEIENKIRRTLERTGSQKEYELKRATNANRAGIWFFTTALKNLKNADEIYQDRKSKKWILKK